MRAGSRRRLACRLRAAMRPRRLFVYGTLRDVKLREALLGRSAARVRIRPARLMGFRILRSPRGDWPVLRRSPKSRVIGECLEPLVAAQLRRLGRYEGVEYRLTVVRVRGLMVAGSAPSPICRAARWPAAAAGILLAGAHSAQRRVINPEPGRR
ncbi:MAG: gamma-glutamylcyclotransferase [Alphaproteobacteria bacterium]|nr:gamma-glutamylcyclotransferase [Alphaproteobacteria bacterium]